MRSELQRRETRRTMNSASEFHIALTTLLRSTGVRIVDRWKEQIAIDFLVRIAYGRRGWSVEKSEERERREKAKKDSPPVWTSGN